ncbi:hypothetical protein CVD28_01185 [Bacillus sp. M6-12]|uniref:hypothetical protein n=1 Tax=Bacillus sp. M6-12 TaxID=2054166 RepID=UPI000C76CCA7|nr:hypothetical protein [Bacillus sp. M6-12]PLS19047.1 hypothetical protein CVD28_01185 [Bacillus sp. M6-12]
MTNTKLSDVLTVLTNIDAPIYSMAIPNQKREVIGYSVTYALDGFSVKLKGNPNTKKYQKILSEWGELVRDALLQSFAGQMTYHSLNEFKVKECKM